MESVLKLELGAFRSGTTQLRDIREVKTVSNQKQQTVASEKTPGTALAPTPQMTEWVVLQKQCKAFIASGFLPDHIWKGCSAEMAIAKALTIAMKGKELGIPILQSFTSITVIKGKPCLSAELMLALIYQRLPGAKVTFKTPPDKQTTEAEIVMQRPHGEAQTFRFTIADAKTAGLVTAGSAWVKYPAAMLRARAISAGARAVFPDCIMGCYTPEEMGGEVLEAEYEVQAPSAQPSGEDAPQTQPEAQSAESTEVRQPTDDTRPISEAQMKMLHAVGKENGYSHEDLSQAAHDIFGLSSLTELNRSQFQLLLNEFSGSDPKAPALGSDEDIANAARESSHS
jgi:hypothetical protein